jgi:glutathione S-transferase
VPELTLFYSPRACSLACHIALQESGLPFTASPVRIRLGEHDTEEYRRVNPWGKVPALRIDDAVLTETPAILGYVADAAPAANLLPRGALARARAQEWMSFLSGTVHIAFRPLFRPNRLVGDESLYPALLDIGLPTLRKTLLEVDRRLEGRTWALGDDYSVCDPYLLVFHIWSQREDVIGHVADMPNWMAHRRRIEARSATQVALAREGITPENVTNR